MKNYSIIGFALSSQGLLDELEAEIQAENPSWGEDKIAKEMDKILKDATLYNSKNKKPKKSEKADKEKTKKDK